jgi:hypothetical protein
VWRLGVRVVLFVGKDCGDWVCKKVAATNRIDEFVESNDRRWRSTAFTNSDGIAVIVAAHPGIADWTKPATDPSPLVQRVLAGMRWKIEKPKTGMRYWLSTPVQKFTNVFFASVRRPVFRVAKAWREAW